MDVLKKKGGDDVVRGTTPTLEFKIPFETNAIQNVYITFNQSNQNILEKTENDCIMEGKTITCKLSQTDTLLFDERLNIDIQIRIKTITDEALASNIITESVRQVLKDGEI